MAVKTRTGARVVAWTDLVLQLILLAYLVFAAVVLPSAVSELKDDVRNQEIDNGEGDSFTANILREAVKEWVKEGASQQVIIAGLDALLIYFWVGFAISLIVFCIRACAIACLFCATDKNASLGVASYRASVYRNVLWVLVVFGILGLFAQPFTIMWFVRIGFLVVDIVFLCIVISFKDELKEEMVNVGRTRV